MSLASAAAAEFVRERLALAAAPDAAIVLGSGLGGLEKSIESAATLDYADVPGFAPSSVQGHAGRMIAGSLGGRRVLAFAGRFHMYEGHAPAMAGLPARIASALGARILLLSNAAGGIRRTFRPGDLMLLSDHVNLSGRNPLIGPVVPGDSRFPDMSQPYDGDIRRQLRAAAARMGIALQEGVYGGLLGPSYETPAEVRMLERLGVDAVGMSTVPEVIVARATGMRCAAISCIANLAPGLTQERITHSDVLDVTTRAAGDFERLVVEFLRTLDA